MAAGKLEGRFSKCQEAGGKFSLFSTKKEG
jgi:hypothetical protein